MTQNRDCANAIDLAMTAWAAGEIDTARAVFAKNTDALSAHQGRGEIKSYFAPALFFRSLCELLIEVDFPMTPLLTDPHEGSVAWMSWPCACELVAAKDPEFLVDMLKYGFSEGNLEPLCWANEGDRNFEISLSYLPSGLVDAFTSTLADYLNSSADQWCDRLIVAAHALAKVNADALPVPSDCEDALEQMREMEASEEKIAEFLAALR